MSELLIYSLDECNATAYVLDCKVTSLNCSENQSNYSVRHARIKPWYYCAAFDNQSD